MFKWNTCQNNNKKNFLYSFKILIGFVYLHMKKNQQTNKQKTKQNKIIHMHPPKKKTRKKHGKNG